MLSRIESSKRKAETVDEHLGIWKCPVRVSLINQNLFQKEQMACTGNQNLVNISPLDVTAVDVIASEVFRSCHHYLQLGNCETN